jgi:hypothetical protein
MKNFFSLLLTCVLLVSFGPQTFSQVEKGDANIGFNTQLSSLVGVDATNASGSIYLSYQYYVSNNVSLGLGPLISFNSSDASSQTTIGLNFFANYNFLTANGKTLPYLGAVFLLSNSFIEAGTSYIDTSNKSFGVNGGLKYFLSERVNLDGNLSYTTILSTSVDVDGQVFEPDPEGGILQFTFGLGVIIGKKKSQ